MASRGSAAHLRNSPVVPVDERTLQSLFDTLKANHCALRGELKSLINRSRAKGEIGNLKSIMLDYPPLHELNEMLEEILESPVRPTRGTVTVRRAVTPQPSRSSKKRSADGSNVAASKALKFSPHLFKTEAGSPDDYSPLRALQNTTADSDEKDADDDDDVIEIAAI